MPFKFFQLAENQIGNWPVTRIQFFFVVEIREPVFRVRVRLSSDEMLAYGEHILLQPGLLLSADIVFDRRSLIKWLFDPLFAVAERS